MSGLGRTALLEAIVVGGGTPSNIQTIALLIEAGADVNIPDFHGVSPRAHAVARGYTSIFDLFPKLDE